MKQLCTSVMFKNTKEYVNYFSETNTEYIDGIYITIILDATGSMSDCLRPCCEAIKHFSRSFSDKQSSAVFFRIIVYRNICNVDQNNVVNIFPYTQDLDEIVSFVNTVGVNGGN